VATGALSFYFFPSYIKTSPVVVIAVVQYLPAEMLTIFLPHEEYTYA